MSAHPGPERRFRPLPHTQVTIADRFWAPRLEVNRRVTLAAEYRQCKQTGRIDAFRLDWQPGREPVPHIFWDSDVAKWVEAASYSLATHPDQALAGMLQEVVDLIVAAQQPDGYLNVHFTVVEPEKRWSNLRGWHELYSAGHLIEAAVAHHQATGSRALLDCLCRYADYIGTVFGTRPGQKRGYCGHEEIELALVRLYRATGERRYLDLATYFVNERGQKPCYFAQEAQARGEQPGDDFSTLQAHLPVREQTEVVGHAVRAMYLYSAMADLAGETRDESLLAACRRLWDNLTLRRMYVTGGIGSWRRNEGFTSDYDLPNETAYAETCAAIGLVFWAHRMLQLECDGRYADVMERALYNGVVSGVSLDGTRFFYENPLASLGDHHRQDWFRCACCPPNLARLLASLGQYVYMVSEDSLAVHLYVQGEAQGEVAGVPVAIRQETDYPWQGQADLTLEPASPVDFTLRLRMPAWCDDWKLWVNGRQTEVPVEAGYSVISRTWQPGDRVKVLMGMPAARIVAHPAVAPDRGLIALQRGPLVYCLEDVDHEVPVQAIALPRQAWLTPTWQPDLLGGVMVLETEEALAPAPGAWDRALYQSAKAVPMQPARLRAVPYCTWDNREPGGMVVWLREAPTGR